MDKTEAVAALGQAQLLRPAYLKAALAANDRLKFYLTTLQAAQSHAAQPEGAIPDFNREYAAAKPDAPWLLKLPGSARAQGEALQAEDLPLLLERMATDIRAMGRPLAGDDDAAHKALLDRVATWCDWLAARRGGVLMPADLAALTSGRREAGDSFHILVMDLHKSLNHLAASLADETIDGAHVWQVTEEDRPRITAFMRGLNRTRAQKLNHPGLDTAATRDGTRLLIQNDIGTNDAHVLVMEVEGTRLSLTYSDLHRQRFAFFQDLLSEIGAVWSARSERTTAGLNAGQTYYLGTAVFNCADMAALDAALEGLGASIVFLIDWNRARKRLRLVVGKAVAMATLAESARRGIGHMGWLAAGGERLLFDAMEAVGVAHFRIGDRLDTVLGVDQARAFLLDLMAATFQAMAERQPLPRIADATRLLLLRHLGEARDMFELLSEHAAYCHALAEGLRDGLAHRVERDADAAARLALRAKRWEREADRLVNQSRRLAERNGRWLPFTRLIEQADDVADTLEEAIFQLSLMAERQGRAADAEPWHGDVREALARLAARTCEAVQDHVKALAIARVLQSGGTAEDHEGFLAVSWRLVEAEQQCDQDLREVRRALVRHACDPIGFSLVAELAGSIEMATDALMAGSFAMRALAFDRLGQP